MSTRIRFSLALILGLLATLPSFAAPPQTLNYQGYLTSTTGTPTNSTVQMTFRLYNAVSGGVALYTETQPSVSVTNGSFNAIIGTVIPIPLPFDVPYWLTVAVNSDAEMSPRQPLASSAYAFRAASVDAAASIGGAQISGSITNATLPATQITGTINAATAVTVTGGVAGSQISGAITTATIGGAQVSGPVASATAAASFSGPLGGDITGQQGSTTISAIRGSAVSAVVPTDGQVLIFRGGQWQPAADVANLLASVASLVSPRAYVTDRKSVV